ncbi:MAG: hypothetical protein GY953_58895, partial [bacterium]|nr:hypothetical protein [bacterium]
MELLLYAGLFYAWQCLAFVPADAVIFDSGLWRAHHRRGGGVRWLNPWPGALGLVTQGLPFIVDDDGVLSFLPAGWRSRPLIPPSRRTARWDQLVGAVAAGCRVRVAGKVFVRGASPRHTRNLAALLARLGKAQSKPRRALKKELGRSFSGQRAVRRLAEAKAASRWLDLWCGVYLLTLALALPALMWRWGELTGFLLLVPWIVLI